MVAAAAAAAPLSSRSFDDGPVLVKQRFPLGPLTIGVFTYVLLIVLLLVQVSVDDMTRFYSEYSDPRASLSSSSLRWVQYPTMDTNETEQLMDRWRALESNECHGVGTGSIRLLGPVGPVASRNGSVADTMRLVAGPAHEIVWESIGDDGRRRCVGGDFFEADLSGPRWKSRPPVLDHDDGTYTMTVQVHPEFAGARFHLNVTLLFDNLHGLALRPKSRARLTQVLSLTIDYVRPPPPPSTGKPWTSPVGLPELKLCTRADFGRKHWAGRWTRDDEFECPIDEAGRYDCLDPELDCPRPWCRGPVAKLESSGWVYSAHCAFRIFRAEEAWRCLNGTWIFAWGDSNMIDSIGNLLRFVLGLNDTPARLDRRMDRVFRWPSDERLSVRITSVFNGSHNVSKNWEGLFSLHDEDYRSYLRSFFADGKLPDFMIMNSGQHDGLYWRSADSFLIDGVQHALRFWKEIWQGMGSSKLPHLIYRTTVASAGRHRPEPNNPEKMEFYNHLIVDQLMRLDLPNLHIVDSYDPTFPWHYGNRHSDGVHYGRTPSKSKIWMYRKNSNAKNFNLTKLTWA
ncbi:hypothetical protein AXG93_4009s1210 [Marchantia polymorpha subsp. ruderalis]|uniref:Uncharacterized protein n=1 Tax=Marchantia polymorpha subsp. ruderalis TaxID=1480154 RepID=A0A176W2D0_MARPO|nr:hypothetical protein AXG93_4009s1210 [Marchantia polymorpha subsp. ruderalis]